MTRPTPRSRSRPSRRLTDLLPAFRDSRRPFRRVRPEPHTTREVKAWLKPARLFLLTFLAVDLVGALLLTTPLATVDDQGLVFHQALFTSTSALTVCGLSVISIGGQLSGFGQGVVLALVQAGGMGIMTLASLLGAAMIHRFGLRMRLTVQAETHTPWIGDVRGLVGRVLSIFLVLQGATFLLITPRMWLAYDLTLPQALYSGFFHSVMAFNNAGLSLYDDGFIRFSGDAFVLLPVAVAMILGGIGLPVLLELRRRLRRAHRWTLHTELTVVTTVLLIIGGTALVTAMEWSNPSTLGGLHWWARLTDGFFQGVMPRSGGFNAVPVGEMREATLLVTIMLMFVGGGSAGTAGGIKVATLAVIFLVVVTEVRAHDQVHVFGRRLPSEAVRHSLSLVFLSATLVAVATVLMLWATEFTMLPVLFEVVSAFGVVGLSTGITPDLAPWNQYLLAVLMVAGRIGPITFVTALAFRDRRRRYGLPEAKPIIG